MLKERFVFFFEKLIMFYVFLDENRILHILSKSILDNGILFENFW